MCEKQKLKVKLINWDGEYRGKKDFPLYKIIPYKYLLQWIYAEKVRFDQVSKWDDVYELFLFKQNYVQKDGSPYNLKAENFAFYGQSWTLLTSESDALWRIYSPDKLSVKIKTTYNKIGELLENSDAFSQKMGAYFGMVEYMKTKQIEEKIDEYVKDITSENNIANSLCIKRDAFFHEKEFRIILWKETVKEVDGRNVPSEIPNYINLSIRPSELIQEISFDYRLDNNLYSCLKSIMQVLLPNVKIKKSPLGTFKPKTYTI